jgi:hypothetical protein
MTPQGDTVLQPTAEHLISPEADRSVELHDGDKILERSLADIQATDDRVAEALGLDKDSQLAVEKTSNALAYIAEKTIEQPDVTRAQRLDVMEDVVVDSLYAMQHGVPVEKTSMGAFGFEGHDQPLMEIMQHFEEAEVVLPGYDKPHETSEVLSDALEKLATHQEPGDVEVVPAEVVSDQSVSGWEQMQGSVQGFAEQQFLPAHETNESVPTPEKMSTEKAMIEAARRAEVMAEVARGRTEFSGEKVNKAIDSYYVDHEVSLTALEAVASADDSAGAEEMLLAVEKSGVQSEVLSVALKEALALKSQGGPEYHRSMETALALAYAEPCVGQLTLNEQDVDRIVATKMEIARKAGIPGNEENRLASMRQGMYMAQSDARNEVRNAGQLLFHNTNFGEKVWAEGAIRGRAKQLTAQEKVYMTTGNSHEAHSVVPHWSELYSSNEYKRGVAGAERTGKFYEEETAAMTVAAPLAEIIEHAPYGRGVEYAVVDAKYGAEVYALPVGLEGKTCGSIGPGAADFVGSERASIDRVFWASADSAQEGADYEIPVHGQDIMQWDAEKGREDPTTYLIQSSGDVDHNRKNKFARMNPADLPQGMTAQEAFDLETTDPDRSAALFGNSILDPNRGTGYGDPNKVVIQDTGNSLEENAGAEEAIRELQKDSVRRFKGKFVVPLRAVANAHNKFLFRADSRVENYYGKSVEGLLA